MLQSYGKTADEWGDLPPEVRYFHEQAWIEQGERNQSNGQASGDFSEGELTW
ncbi:hypothetical protein [Halorubrum sp. C191]|uniref:hypothetical protein n=1 Tax=Halorubrum sp. C191 TaxID=1383842 RepID=UPI0013047AE5|nr:hypothetical protein [Halorubrum sp. C191]